jgi:hypothetical protein
VIDRCEVVPNAWCGQDTTLPDNGDRAIYWSDRTARHASDDAVVVFNAGNREIGSSALNFKSLVGNETGGERMDPSRGTEPSCEPSENVACMLICAAGFKLVPYGPRGAGGAVPAGPPMFMDHTCVEVAVNQSHRPDPSIAERLPHCLAGCRKHAARCDCQTQPEPIC